MPTQPGCHDDPDETRDAWCFCSLAHPLLAWMLRLVWRLLPGRLQGWVCDDPCWLQHATER